MSNKTTIQIHEKKMPTIQDLYENTDLAIKHDDLAVILNHEPPSAWIKEHPYIKGWKYLPIDKVEFMLARLFKVCRISILREGVAFNGVYVVVKVEYQHPITGNMEWHDGIGALQLQTAKGKSPADLANINNGAISMAFPIAKSLAVKDATDHIGKLFGRDLNRKDVIPYNPDEKLHNVKREKEIERLRKLIAAATGLDELEALMEHVEAMADEELTEEYEARVLEFNKEQEVEDEN